MNIEELSLHEVNNKLNELIYSSGKNNSEINCKIQGLIDRISEFISNLKDLEKQGIADQDQLQHLQIRSDSHHTRISSLEAMQECHSKLIKMVDKQTKTKRRNRGKPRENAISTQQQQADAERRRRTQEAPGRRENAISTNSSNPYIIKL